MFVPRNFVLLPFILTFLIPLVFVCGVRKEFGLCSFLMQDNFFWQCLLSRLFFPIDFYCIIDPLTYICIFVSEFLKQNPYYYLMDVLNPVGEMSHPFLKAKLNVHKHLFFHVNFRLSLSVILDNLNGTLIGTAFNL